MESKLQNHVIEINDMLEIYRKLKILKMKSNLMAPEEYLAELEILKLSLKHITGADDNDQLSIILRNAGIDTNN